jgi:hypothetical protein
VARTVGRRVSLQRESINLDFHSVPYVGEHPVVEAHYLPRRSRRQPSILTFLAQDADSQVLCYSNADIRKGEEAEEIFRLIEFWKRQHGKLPQRLVFDPKLTTYEGLDQLDAAGITFMTLRRRSKGLLVEVDELAASAWRTITLDLPSRNIAHPKSSSRRSAFASAPISHRSSGISTTMNPLSLSPRTGMPAPATSSFAMPSAC